MPALSEPPNRVPFMGEDQRPSPYWQQWFTRLYRSLAPPASAPYFYIPTNAGAPTATPEVRAGFVPMVYDTSNEDLYVYNGAWVKVALA